jgi:hypothetical protein
MLDFTINLLEVHPLHKAAGSLKEAVVEAMFRSSKFPLASFGDVFHMFELVTLNPVLVTPQACWARHYDAFDELKRELPYSRFRPSAFRLSKYNTLWFECCR